MDDGTTTPGTSSRAGTGSDASLSALSSRLEDPVFQRWAADLVALTAILDYCIVNANFRVSDSWVSPIVLTDIGKEFERKVGDTSKKLRSNELRLAVFLKFGCPDGLLVDASTSLDDIRRVLSEALQSQRVLLPYIYGRELHDLSSEMYPEQHNLDNSKTVRLLRELPTGVFQSGHFVTGPYGCHISSSFRMLQPTQSVPGYLCSDVTCHQTHSIHLTSGTTSPIHRATEAIRDFVVQNYPEYDEHIPLIRRAMLKEADAYRQPDRDAVFDAIADSLSTEELRAVVDHLLRQRFKEEPQSRTGLSRITGSAIANPTEFAASLRRPAMLQILLLHSDEQVSNAVDNAIEVGALALEEFDIRTSRLNRSGSSYRAEIGKSGIRLRSPRSTETVALHLYRLLQHLYVDSGVQTSEDLRYLAGIGGTPSNAAELLTQVVHSVDPESIITDLVLSSRSTAIAAAEYLWISEPNALSRDDLRDALTWRLGLPGAVGFNDVEEVEGFADRLLLAVDAGEREDEIRGLISNMFTSLESALERGLSFTAWSLTTDHLVTSAGFEFEPRHRPTWDFINSTDSVRRDQSLALADRNDLSTLGSGYSLLAKGLETLQMEDWERPAVQFPDECVLSGRPFAFNSQMPFLNLDSASRASLKTTLSTVGGLIQDQGVVGVRNATLHGNKEFPSADTILGAVNAVHAACRQLKLGGIFPTVFELTQRCTDGFGRDRLTYESATGSVELRRPSWVIAPRMPTGPERLVILTRAVVPGVGPLRFRLATNPDTDYWRDWPKRWRTRGEYTADHPSATQDEDVEAPLTA